MLSKVRSYRPSHTVVVAYLSLFVALGGSSYAAIKVTGKNVKDSSLTGKDIKNSSLGTADLKNGNLLAADFKAGQLPAGPQGPRGLTGPAGPAGQRGPAGATKVVQRNGTEGHVSPGSLGSSTATCHPGERATGGGGAITGGGAPSVFRTEAVLGPDGTPTGWVHQVWNASTNPGTTVVARVICASP